MFEATQFRQMPIRLPLPGAIRHAIAEKAAETSAASIDHFLDLLGPVEPTFGTHGQQETGWRLAYYRGSRDESTAIERAVGQVQRQTPLMRPN